VLGDLRRLAGHGPVLSGEAVRRLVGDPDDHLAGLGDLLLERRLGLCRQGQRDDRGGR
jgi:hypothetical protein